MAPPGLKSKALTCGSHLVSASLEGKAFGSVVRSFGGSAGYVLRESSIQIFTVSEMPDSDLKEVRGARCMTQSLLSEIGVAEVAGLVLPEV